MSASVHALPSCPTERIFELRRAAQSAGCQFSRVKPKPRTAPAPFDPNDGGARSMKPTIEELLLQILSTVLIINQQGTWHAFLDLQGHVSGFTVRVCSADTDYRDAGHEVDRRTGYWQAEYLSPQACQSKLASTLTWLQGYLDMPATPSQEVAA